ncbi:methyltransferase domain-containing protein [Streptomyces sp. NPDC005776]|uniref:class I SAM-dependent DNA methyltransferase n=1 Tax=Streptomyces sp. NPDC005776 TaxID=3154676 RepID=UPI0033F44DFF
MTPIPTLPATRAYYDTVAEDYAERVRLPFAQDALGRAMLGAFADEVRADGGLPVADLGCGPGHVAAHLDALGLRVRGVDVSPRMVDIARRSHPDLRFEVGSMHALGFPDGALGGIVAWWSILHTPPDLLPLLFAEFRRVLTSGGRLLLGFHAGDGQPYTGKERENGVAYAIHLLDPGRVGAQLAEAGFTVTANLLGEGEKWPQACVFARASARGGGASQE